MTTIDIHHFRIIHSQHSSYTQRPHLIQKALIMESENIHSSSACEDLWDQHAPLIRQLYEVERKTLKQVKDILETEYQFPNSP